MITPEHGESPGGEASLAADPPNKQKGHTQTAC